jgi:hypothetical protein
MNILVSLATDLMKLPEGNRKMESEDARSGHT